jgi:hypothetical protein
MLRNFFDQCSLNKNYDFITEPQPLKGNTTRPKISNTDYHVTNWLCRRNLYLSFIAYFLLTHPKYLNNTASVYWTYLICHKRHYIRD